MSRISNISKKYAIALFRASKKSGFIEEVLQYLEIFNNNFTHEFAVELNNPAISKSDSIKIMSQLCEAFKIKGLSKDFLVTMSQNKRLSYFKEVYEEFKNLVKKDKKIIVAEIISAYELDKNTLDEIKKTISNGYNDRQIEIKEIIKETILGGIQIRIGSSLIDGSLRNQIENLEKDLNLTIN